MDLPFSPPSLPSTDPSSLLGALGLPTPQPAQPQTVAKTTVPVQTTPPSAIRRSLQSFSSDDIKTNWNAEPTKKPYYFQVRPAETDGSVTTHYLDQSVLQAMGLNYDTIYFYIAPSAINVQNQFAINVSATNGGILEEHNGVVFRTITISGTTGLLPQKTNRRTKTNPVQQVAASLFPAATSAVVGLISSVKAGIQSVTGGNNSDLDSINGQLDFTQTGWFQFWQLNNFLIAYAQAKKGMRGQDVSGIRLLFGSKKDNIAYVVTPVNFSMKRDVSNPLLYRYDMTLRAWDLAQESSIVSLPDADIVAPDAQSIVAAVTGVLTSARTIIRAASNVLSGAQSDLTSILNIYNQALLVTQDAAGLVSQIGTFGQTFYNNRQSLLLNSSRNQTQVGTALSTLQSTSQATALGGTAGGVSAILGSSLVQKSQQLSSSNAAILAGLGVIPSGVIKSTTPSGETRINQASQSISPTADTLLVAALNSDYMQDLPINKLDLPSVIQQGIASVRTASQALTATDIQNLANNLQNLSNNYVSTIGAMDPTFAAIYGVPAATSSSSNASISAPTANDILTAVAIQEAKTAFVSTLATGQFFLQRDPDPFLAANQSLPSNSQIPTPSSSIAVAWQRGATLDTIAQQYLGDASRSREIAVLNNLRSPYIDESGFSIGFTAANGRTFVVDDISNLAIGQKITLQSGSASPTKRTILNIESIGSSEWQITVDGLPNLSMYTPSSSPSLTAFLPGTVGPGQVILIPSDIVPAEFAAIRPTNFFSSLSSADQVFKVDMALDTISAQDLYVGADGDIQLSYGYTNAVQALRLAVETEKGELDRHPSYGLAVPIGSRNADLNFGQIETAVTSTIVNDPRFVDTDVNITINGSAVLLDIMAHGASGTGQIPVTFEIGKSG